jgi:glutamyl-tRNA reductase
VIPFVGLAEALRETDIVASATSAPHPMLTVKLMREALPKGAHSPLCIIDMALPRDVEPEVGDIRNVFLYDLDDLRQVVDDNLARRMAELPRAEGLIESAVADYWRWYRGRRAGPVIRALREHAERQRRADLEDLFARLPHLSSTDRAAIDDASRRMVNRMLHGPTVRLREAAANGAGSEIVDAARRLFALDETELDDETDTDTGESAAR